MAPDRRPAQAHATTVVDGIGDRVGQILALHREGTDGWCLGCAEEGTLRFHPCPSASWAWHVGCRAEPGRYHGGTPGARRSP